MESTALSLGTDCEVAVQDPIPDLVTLFLARRSTRTREAYAWAFQDFARHLCFEAPVDAARQLVEGDRGEAHRLAMGYGAALLERGLSPATVNLRPSALRSVVALARTAGSIDWHLEIPGEKAESYRDTQGPGRAGYLRMLEAARGQKDPRKAARDEGLVRMLFDLALRREEVVRLDLEDLDLEGKRLAVCRRRLGVSGGRQ